MKKIICLVFALLLFNPSILYAAVIFSENYDNIESGWSCGNSIPAGWTRAAGCPSPSSYGGVTHYAGEISSGGRTGNSLKLWRRNGIWTDYHGYLDKDFTTAEFNNHYKELYIRWYVKIPAEWDANVVGVGGTCKLNRLYFSSEAEGEQGEWLMDIKGSTFKTGKFSFYCVPEGNVWYTQKTVSELDVNDGQWHSLEWHVKLNSTTGSSDGGWDFYVDGVTQVICDGMGQNCTTGKSNMNMGAASGQYFTSMLPPAIGNLNGGTWTFPTDGWYAIEFDDYVVSGSPSSSATESSDGGGGCFIATAAFGSALTPSVRVLRQFRDELLMENELGRTFVTFYREISPPIADFIARHDSARVFVRLSLLPLVGICWVLLMIGPMQTLLLVLLIIVLAMKQRALPNLLQKSP